MRCPLNRGKTKQYKFVYDGIELTIKQKNLQDKNLTPKLITLTGYTHPVFSLPHLIDENGEIDPVSFCDDGHGGERCRRGCFVELNQEKFVHWRVFIVERANSTDMVIAIEVQNCDLVQSIAKLIEDEHSGEVGFNCD